MGMLERWELEALCPAGLQHMEQGNHTATHSQPDGRVETKEFGSSDSLSVTKYNRSKDNCP